MIKFIKAYFVMDYVKCLMQARFMYGDGFSMRRFNTIYAIGFVLMLPILPLAIAWYAYQLKQIEIDE